MFIDRINEALKRKGMKGKELCNKLEIPNSNYTQWKEFIPRGQLLKRIADELDVSVDWLLERERAPDPEETKLLNDYRDSDDIGRETICNIADLQAKRSRKAKEDEQLKPFA